MATYRVQAPDGAWYRFSGPDNATDAEVHAYAQAQAKAHADRLAATQAEMRAMSDPTKDMNWGQKALANVGAGLDTTWQGTKQLVGQGGSDADVREKRAIDKHLAQQTTGGGALQTVGEAAPMLAVPGAGLVGGALAGAAGGALQPVTSDESRLKNAAVGGVAGGAIGKAFPYALGALGKGATTIYDALRGPASGVRQMLQDAAAQGPEALAAAKQAVQEYLARGPDKIPLSSAAAAKSPGLAQLEIGARVKDPAAFYPLDQQQGAAVFKKTLDATQGGTKQNIEALRNARKAEWESNWKTAMDVADPQVFAAEMPKFRANLDAAANSTESSNPAVLGVVNQIRSEMDRLGDNFTPGHLQQIRANLNARGAPMPQNAYQSAPRDSSAVNSLIDEMDNVLNKTTNGAWDAVKGGYQASTEGVNAAKAAARVRGKFVNEAGEPVITAIDPEGTVPAITQNRMQQALKGSQDRAGREMLDPATRAPLEESLKALQQQGITRRVKDSGSGGGGSDTMVNRYMSERVADFPGMKSVRGVIDTMVNMPKREQLLADALRDPEILLGHLDTPTLTTRASNFADDVAQRTRLDRLANYLRYPASNAPRALGGAAAVDVLNPHNN